MGVLLISEVRRIFRSPRFLIFTIGFPVIYFLIFAGLYGGNDQVDGISQTAYLMLSMAAFGAITAALSTGSRVAIERQVGWNRQLRLTPLPGWSYLVIKAAVAMLVALPALLLVFAVGGFVKGVDLTAVEWLGVFLVAWLGVLPFAAIGLLVGMAATADSAQSMSTVTMLIFSLLGGLFIPVPILPPALAGIAKALPSYWLAENARGQISGAGTNLVGVAVMAAWLVVVGGLVVVRYQRDALRV